MIVRFPRSDESGPYPHQSIITAKVRKLESRIQDPSGRRTKQEALQKISNMPLSSLYTCLKFLLRGKDAKPPLGGGSSKPRTKSPSKMEQEVDDKLSIISTASARVSSIAARGIQNMIKAQAGASTASNMTFRAAKQISQGTKIPLVIVASFERHARDTARAITHRSDADRLAARNLQTITARISHWTHQCDVRIRDFIDSVNHAEGKYARKSPRYRASVVAALTALAEVICTVAQIVEAHSVTVRQTNKSVPYIKELLLGIHLATSQAVFAAAETVAVVDRRRPPPKEKKSS